MTARRPLHGDRRLQHDFARRVARSMRTRAGTEEMVYAVGFSEIFHVARCVLAAGVRQLNGCRRSVKTRVARTRARVGAPKARAGQVHRALPIRWLDWPSPC